MVTGAGAESLQDRSSKSPCMSVRSAFGSITCKHSSWAGFHCSHHWVFISVNGQNDLCRDTCFDRQLLQIRQVQIIKKGSTLEIIMNQKLSSAQLQFLHRLKYTTHRELSLWDSYMKEDAALMHMEQGTDRVFFFPSRVNTLKHN